MHLWHGAFSYAIAGQCADSAQQAAQAELSAVSTHMRSAAGTVVLPLFVYTGASRLKQSSLLHSRLLLWMPLQRA